MKLTRLMLNLEVVIKDNSELGVFKYFTFVKYGRLDYFRINVYDQIVENVNNFIDTRSLHVLI